MNEFAQPLYKIQRHHGALCARSDRSAYRPSPLERHSPWGNQALQRMLQTRTIQGKLTVTQPGDKDELEADRMAQQVMRIPDAALLARSAYVPGKSFLQGEPTKSDSDAVAEAPAIVHEVLASMKSWRPPAMVWAQLHAPFSNHGSDMT